MVVYSIKDVEKLSGIKAHTIRIWEKRYGIVVPKRTPTNIRYYLDEDVQKILDIAFLNKQGYKISKIAAMSDFEIKRKVSDITEIQNSPHETKVDALMHSILELNELKCNRILNRNIEQIGLEATFEDTIYPLLTKLNLLAIANNIKSVHETFVVNTIKAKIISSIDQLPERISKPEKFIIYLPENDTHELNLLYLHYIIKKAGFDIINLGTTSLNEVSQAHQIWGATHIFGIFNDSFVDTPMQPYIDRMVNELNEANILISGFQTMIQNIASHPRVRILSSLHDVQSFIENL